MSVTVQFKRNNDNITNGELNVNTTNKEISVSNKKTIASSFSRLTQDEYDRVRILSVDDEGRLVDHKGEPIREIGCNTGSWFLSAILYDRSDVFINVVNEIQLLSWDGIYDDIARYAAFGFKYVRCNLPNWTATWHRATYDALGKEEYWRRINHVLDTLYEHGVGTWFIPSMGHYWFSQYYGSDGDGPSDWLNPDHPSMVGLRNWIKETCENIGHHPAIAGWDCSGEPNQMTEWNNFIHSDAEDPNAVVFSDEQITAEHVRGFIQVVADAFDEFDPYNRPYRSGCSDSPGEAGTWTENKNRVFYLDGPASVVGKNTYPRNNQANRSAHDLRDEIVMWRRLAKDIGKPYIIGESGMLLYERERAFELDNHGMDYDPELLGNITSYTNYGFPYSEEGGLYGWDFWTKLYKAIEGSGIQLSFAWAWSRFALGIDDPNNGVYKIGLDHHPDNIENGNWRWTEDVRRVQQRLREEGYVDPYDVPLSKFSQNRSSDAVQFTRGNYLRYDVESGVAHEGNNKGFTCSFWLKMDSVLDTQFNVLIDTHDNVTGKGVRIYVGPDGTLKMFITTPNGDGTSQFSGALSRTENTTDGWNHFVVQIQNSRDGGRIGMWRNGKTIGPGELGFDWDAWPGANTSIVTFGGAQNGSSGFNGELAHVCMFRNPLTPGQIYDLYMYDKRPQFSRRWEWDFEGTLDSNHTDANGWVYTSKTAVIGGNTPPALTNNFILPTEIVK